MPDTYAPDLSSVVENKPIVVMSYNFQFMTRTRERAMEIMDEIAKQPEVPEEVVAYIKKSIYGMTVFTEHTLVEVKAEGHMPQLGGNSQQLGNCIITVRAITIRE